MARLLQDTQERSRGLFARHGRRLELTDGQDSGDVQIPGDPVAEILGVLLDHARVHGRGTVRLTVRDLGDALAFDVTDEGQVAGDPARLFERGRSAGEGSGVGLALARDLATGLGGRLSATHARPATFTLLVPSGVHRAEEPGPSGAPR
ncbi:ATP-binding protein [Streptomyces sp. NPDC052496]|uniref:ATP-binding protein n=1 Tax=Streptomyces sp. NPDC052496 TaxID=3154951 RepID=UPI003442C2C3